MFAGVERYAWSASVFSAHRLAETHRTCSYQGDGSGDLCRSFPRRDGPRIVEIVRNTADFRLHTAGTAHMDAEFVL